MITRTLGAVLILGVLFAPSAKAQQSKDDMTELSSFLFHMGTSPLDRAVASVGNAVEINAATDSSNATIKVSRSASTPHNGQYSTFTLTASAPVDKSADRTDLVTLDGLRNAFTLGAKYTWFQIEGLRNPTKNPSDNATNDEICAELTATVNRQTGSTGEALCDTNHVKMYLPERYVEYRSLYLDPSRWMISLGIEPKVGYQKFSFLEPETLNKGSNSKVPWSVDGFLAFTPKGGQTLITVSGSYQKGFKNADNGILCPSGGSGTVVCKTGPVGEPVSDDAELLSVELRRRFGGAGASLKVTYDFKEDLTGVDLPITFIRDKDGSLTGGIRVGWTSTGHWQAGIFAGKAFNLFGG